MGAMTKVDYHRRRRAGAYRHLPADDVNTVAKAFGIDVEELCETAQRCEEKP
jgi:hypothetical protein